jgi:hypothetical protein
MMNAILNKVVPNRKVDIRIIKDGFSSPVLGNTYIGQIKTLNIATATRFVKGGYAEFVDSKQGGTAKKSAADEGAGKDAGNGGEKEPLALEDAIKALDPADDAHWTKSGLPDLNVLKELTGEAVKRQDVEDVAPDFTREVAAENKG